MNGKPRFGENTMPAFRDSAERGFVLELDVKLTGDNVPVVFHDATLDRVTDCDGRIDPRTYARRVTIDANYQVTSTGSGIACGGTGT